MKPNVLQIISSFHQGGSERQGVQTTRLLEETGRYQVHLACLDPTGPLRAEADRLGLQIPSFPLTSFYDLNMVTQLRRFVRYLRAHKIDIVQTYDFYTNVFGILGATLARVPARIAARRETGGLRTTAQQFVEQRMFQLAHVVAVNSDAVGRELIQNGVPASKIRTIYNGMDTQRVRPLPDLRREEVLASFNLPQEGNRHFVTIIANMRHAMKDQATFLRAAQRVHAAVPQAAFVLAGEGDLIDSYRDLAAELGLTQDTFFVGRCARVAELLAISDVCVLSSCGVEGFSNSIIEYMAAARPVVATDIGGAAEAVVDGETGYIVQPGDAETMAVRLVELLTDAKQARAMGARGLQVVREKFSCAAQLGRIEVLYDELLRKRKASKVFAVARAGEEPPRTRAGNSL